MRTLAAKLRRRVSWDFNCDWVCQPGRSSLGLEPSNTSDELHPEKPQAHSDGRGFNSPHLHERPLGLPTSAYLCGFRFPRGPCFVSNDVSFSPGVLPARKASHPNVRIDTRHCPMPGQVSAVPSTAPTLRPPQPRAPAFTASGLGLHPRPQPYTPLPRQVTLLMANDPPTAGSFRS